MNGFEVVESLLDGSLDPFDELFHPVVAELSTQQVEAFSGKESYVRA